MTKKVITLMKTYIISNSELTSLGLGRTFIYCKTYPVHRVLDDFVFKISFTMEK